MKILTRYVLREHIGPLIFALAALTSLLMLQYVARQLGNLVGKGLPWRIIGEFFVLSLPFTVAMTMPMAVLVATLHAFGRMANEHEITAFKASGVRVTKLMMPVLVGAAFLVVGMIAFNDQVLPRANHRLRMLQQDMSRAKPTLALNEQVLNQVTNGFYMRIGRLDNQSNRMTDITIYDLSQPNARKTIYADSGELSFTPDKKDLQLVLFDGFQQELYGQTSSQLRRSYFRSQAVRVKDIGGDFEQTGADSWKGDREKSICEMQSEYVVNARDYERVRQMYIETARKGAAPGQKTMRVPKPRPATEGVARLYCNALALIFRVPTAQPTAAEVAAQAATPNLQTAVANPAATPTSDLPPGSPGTVAGAQGTTPAPTLSPAMLAQIEAARAAVQLAPAAPNPASTGQMVGTTAGQTNTAAPPTAVDSAKMQTVPALPASKDSIQRAIAAAAAANQPPGTTSSTVATNPATGLPVTPPAQPPVQPVVQNPATSVAATPLPAPPTTPVVAPPSTALPAGSLPAGSPPATIPAVIVPPAAGVIVGGTQQPPVALPIPQPSAGIAVPTPSSVPGAAPGTVLPQSAGVSAVSNAAIALSALNGGNAAELAAATSQLSLVRASMDSLAVEVQKKFALSVACIVFVLFGPPIALRFPRGGVGATLGVSLVVFGLYYVCLMAGETLADGGKLPPWIAMWAANVIFTIIGILGLLSIEKTADTSRGGGIKAWFDDRKARRQMRPVRVTAPTAAS